MKAIKTKPEANQNTVGDAIKWLLVLAILMVMVYGNSVYQEESILYRFLAAIVLVTVGAAIAFQTTKGKAIWLIMKGARTEISRIVWPTRTERNQTTLIVVVVVFIVALILWLLDTLLGRLIIYILG